MEDGTRVGYLLRTRLDFLERILECITKGHMDQDTNNMYMIIINSTVLTNIKFLCCQILLQSKMILILTLTSYRFEKGHFMR